MRVCFIEDTDLRGGTQIWVSEAIRNFLDAGTEVTLLTSRTGFNAAAARETKARVVTYDYRDVVTMNDQARGIWTDALTAADVAVCTIHPPRGGFHCSVFAASCIKRGGLETMLIPKTGTIVPEYERRFYVPEEDIRYHVIAITGFTYEYLAEQYGVPERNVSLIYQGTDVVRFQPDESRTEEARRRYRVISPGPLLGCLGSFEERKGQTVLLEAIDRIRTELPGVQLLTVGDGPDEAVLKGKVEEMGLSAHVTFFPFTDSPEYVFQLLDLLVLSSLRKEGLPNVLLEAMAMGVPVVSTRLAGTPEVVKHGQTGFLVDPGDPAQLAAAVVRMWSDRETYDRMAGAARSLMCEAFDKRVQFRRFRKRFEDLSARERT